MSDKKLSETTPIVGDVEDVELSLYDSNIQQYQAMEPAQRSDFLYELQGSQVSSSYAQKKTLAKGCLDLALLMANASQLKTLVKLPSAQRNEFYTPLLIMISLSIGLQVAAGVVLLFLGMSEPHSHRQQRRTENLNNVSVTLILLITVLNVFIASVGISQ